MTTQTCSDDRYDFLGTKYTQNNWVNEDKIDYLEKSVYFCRIRELLRDRRVVGELNIFTKKVLWIIYTYDMEKIDTKFSEQGKDHIKTTRIQK